MIKESIQEQFKHEKEVLPLWKRLEMGMEKEHLSHPITSTTN